MLLSSLLTIQNVPPMRVCQNLLYAATLSILNSSMELTNSVFKKYLDWHSLQFPRVIYSKKSTALCVKKYLYIQ